MHLGCDRGAQASRHRASMLEITKAARQSCSSTGGSPAFCGGPCLATLSAKGFHVALSLSQMLGYMNGGSWPDCSRSRLMLARGRASKDGELEETTLSRLEGWEESNLEKST